MDSETLIQCQANNDQEWMLFQQFGAQVYEHACRNPDPFVRRMLALVSNEISMRNTMAQQEKEEPVQQPSNFFFTN